MGNFCIKEDTKKFDDIEKLEKKKIDQYKKRLLLIYHCKNCNSSYPNNMCKKYGKNCAIVKELIKHIPYCEEENCNIKYCNKFKKALRHFSRCQDFKCKICSDVFIKIDNNYYQQKSNSKYQRSLNYLKMKPKINNYLLLSQSY